jgi:spermidine/putrescine transport system substrate-binding protein
MNSKRFVLMSSLLALIALILMGGASGSPTANAQGKATAVATMAMKDGKKQELKVYNFATYIADDTIANFEKMYNVKVTYDTFGKADELFTKMQAGNPGYDVIVAPDYMITQLASLDLLLPLEMKNIPNFEKNVDPSFKDPSYDPKNKYSVAYQWGTMGIGYNKKKVGKDIKSLADIFKPEYKKRVALLNSTREMMALLLISQGLDPNTVNKADLEKARDFALKNKEVVAAFHDDDGQTRLVRGEVDIVIEWSGDMFQVMAEKGNEDIVYVIPSEGTFRWADNLAIPKGAGNKALAETFINYVYDPGTAAAISNFTQYGSPNKAAIDMKLIDKALLENPAIYPPADVAKKLVTLKDLGDAGVVYDQVWAELTAGVSK